MNPKIVIFGQALWDDLRDPDIFWQLGALALCLGAGWWLARLLRRTLGERARHRSADGASGGEGATAFDQRMRIVSGGFSRILFPLLALVLVLASRAVLVKFQHVNFLNLAVPLLTAFAVVRVAVYLLRQVFAPSGVLAASERWIAIVVWMGVALHFTGWLPEIVDAIDDVVFHVGQQRISLWLIVQTVLAIVLTLLVSLWLANLIEGRLMRAESLNMSLRVAAGRFSKAMLVLAAVLTCLGLLGIDLTVLSVFGGALGVGIGLGLQRIASNYLSGFIILLDRSIRIGDLITVDKYRGSVTQISTRFTVLKALDGVESIIPNETLVNTPVQNLSFTNRENRLTTRVTVAYDSDLDLVKSILQAAAAAHPRVINEPAPMVYLIEFAADGLELELGFWIQDPEGGSLNVRSELNFAIWREFRAQGITIPFPQREVRLLGCAEIMPKALEK